MTSPIVRWLAAAAFWLLLPAWTWLLVRPNPIPEVVEQVPTAWRFLLAKSLHAGGYATLAALGWVWAGSPTARWVVAGGLLLHGVGTEVAQTFVEGREGRVRDVVIDWAGVLVATTIMQVFVRKHLNAGPVFPPDRTG